MWNEGKMQTEEEEEREGDRLGLNFPCRFLVM